MYENLPLERFHYWFYGFCFRFFDKKADTDSKKERKSGI